MVDYPFSERFRRFLYHLYAQQVEYLMIGGYAVIVHGYMRGTGDLDIWVKPTEENGERLIRALSAIGIDTTGVSAGDFAGQSFFRVGREPDRIDLMTEVKGVDFDAAYARRQVIKDRGLPISVIDYPDLLANKQATGRPSDLADIDALKRQRPEQEPGR